MEVPNRNDLNDKDLYRTGTRYKEHLLDVIEDSKGDGAWTGPKHEKEVKERKQKWTMIKGRGKGSGSDSSSSGGIGGCW